jgi:hypothetical protein
MANIHKIGVVGFRGEASLIEQIKSNIMPKLSQAVIFRAWIHGERRGLLSPSGSRRKLACYAETIAAIYTYAEIMAVRVTRVQQEVTVT